MLHVMIRAHTTLSPAAKVFYRSLLRVSRDVESSATPVRSLALAHQAKISSIGRR